MRYVDQLETPVDARDSSRIWHPGILHAWRQTVGGDMDPGHWQGWVRYTVGVGQTHSGWFDADNVRPATWHYPEQPRPRQD